MVGGYDGMAAIFHVIIEQRGKIDPDRTMELLRGWKNANSPRGPIMIDPAEREVVQNIYIREVQKRDGKLVNVDIGQVDMVKDPWKIDNPPKSN